MKVRILVGEHVGLDVAEGGVGLMLDAVVEGLEDIFLELGRAREGCDDRLSDPVRILIVSQARIEHDRIFARDGRMVTSAGVTAGIDLALALVGEDHGAAVSLACAKRLVVVAQRQGGQSQFSPLLLPPSDPATPLGKVQDYVTKHL